MKVIRYYRKNQYGVEREYVCNSNFVQGKEIEFLTGQRTLTRAIRTVIESLSDGAVKFEEVIAP